MRTSLDRSTLRHALSTLAAVAGIALAARSAAGQQPRRSLFNPTPRTEMRELSTDRPDQTESPHTVDAGHLQLEMDFVQMSVDRPGDGAARVASWSVAPFNLKLGLLDRVDVQLVVNPYAHLRVEAADGSGRPAASGFGNVATRLKVNFWGNDGGRTALGVMAFVAWPLPASELRSGRTDWGLIVPFAVNIREGWDLGAMARIDVLADPAGGRRLQLVNSVTVGHPLTNRLGIYAEVLAARGIRDSDWLGQLDVGCTYAVRDSIQLDWGANFGVAGPAPAIQPFVGLSYRF